MTETRCATTSPATRPTVPVFTIHYIYTPIGGASGFAATWDSTSEKPDPVEIEVQSYQDNGLSFIYQTQHSTKDMTFDGRTTR
jgi:hypothetical protein